MIPFSCTCGKLLRAREDLAGKKTRCTGCGEVLRIPRPVLLQLDDEPSPPADDANPYSLMLSEILADDPPPAAPEPAAEDDRDSAYHEYPLPERAAKLDPAASATGTGTSFRKATVRAGNASVLEYSYLILFFALVPLAFSLLDQDRKADIERRIAETIRAASPEERKQIEVAMAGESVSLDDQLAAMPGNKLLGAHLARDSSTHWAYALIAAAGFVVLLSACFSVERAEPWHLVAIGAFTSTVGICILFFVQFCAIFRFGSIRAGGIGLVIMLVLAFIGWSYNSANDPESGFLLSAFGFTFGVGFCEEFTKAIPLFIAFQRHCDLGWRTACLWGLASGVGFGVAEGIMYSSRHYNGIGGADLYLVRFVSCVALHAMWAASVGIAIARNVDEYETVDSAAGFGIFALTVMVVPMLLHGFYDTLLKKEMNAGALLVAVLSFGWLAYHIEYARRQSPGAGRPVPEKRWAY